MKSIDDWVREFGINAIAEVEAIMVGNPKLANKYARKCNNAFSALRGLGDEGRRALVPLLSDKNRIVRANAAVFLLRFSHVEARKVLLDLIREGDFVSFLASEALKRWDEGTWQLDPE